MSVTTRPAASTADRILDVAERMVQQRGFNAFSYADVAAELGVTKPSLHYHFPSKADLGVALLTRYARRFDAALQAIERRQRGAPAKLRRYAELYQRVLESGRLCLCGMLAAESDTLPDDMRDAITGF